MNAFVTVIVLFVLALLGAVQTHDLVHADISALGAFNNSLCLSTYRVKKTTHLSSRSCDILFCEAVKNDTKVQFGLPSKKKASLFLVLQSPESSRRSTRIIIPDTQTGNLTLDNVHISYKRSTTDVAVVSRKFGWSSMADYTGVGIDTLYRVTTTLYYGITALRVLKYIFLFFGFFG